MFEVDGHKGGGIPIVYVAEQDDPRNEGQKSATKKTTYTKGSYIHHVVLTPSRYLYCMNLLLTVYE